MYFYFTNFFYGCVGTAGYCDVMDPPVLKVITTLHTSI